MSYFVVSCRLSINICSVDSNLDSSVDSVNSKLASSFFTLVSLLVLCIYLNINKLR